MMKRLSWWLATAAMLAILAVLGSRLFQAWRAYALLRDDAARLQKKLSDYELENRELRQKLRIAETPEAIERDSKARLNMKKTGEKVVIVVPPLPLSTSTNQNEAGWGERLRQFWALFTSRWR